MSSLCAQAPLRITGDPESLSPQYYGATAAHRFYDGRDAALRKVYAPRPNVSDYVTLHANTAIQYAPASDTHTIKAAALGYGEEAVARYDDNQDGFLNFTEYLNLQGVPLDLERFLEAGAQVMNILNQRNGLTHFYLASQAKKNQTAFDEEVFGVFNQRVFQQLDLNNDRHLSPAELAAYILLQDAPFIGLSAAVETAKKRQAEAVEQSLRQHSLGMRALAWVIERMGQLFSSNETARAAASPYPKIDSLEALAKHYKGVKALDGLIEPDIAVAVKSQLTANMMEPFEPLETRPQYLWVALKAVHQIFGLTQHNKKHPNPPSQFF